MSEMIAEPKKAGLPSHAQLVNKVNRLGELYERAAEVFADVAVRVAGIEARLETLEGPTALEVGAASGATFTHRPEDVISLCPGCGNPAGQCADTCAYERKHAVRVERYGDDAR